MIDLAKLDFSMYLYLITLLVDLYGAGLFVWWWIKRRGATLMFKCVTALLVGDAIERMWLLTSRYLMLYGNHEQYTNLRENPFFGAWTSVSTIVTVIIVFYVTKRIFYRLKITENHPRRRPGDY